MRELEAQLAKVRSKLQEGRCCCNHEQFSAPRIHHDEYAESTTLRQLLALSMKTTPSCLPWEEKAYHPCLWSLPPQKKLLALTAWSLLLGHLGRTSLHVPNKTPLLLQDVSTQIIAHPDSNP
ncbi:hypothetical protein DSO57_1020082 [Entomophthora muscae]|uniref:Uncharacterized protein n=1 Tax=Entomophthora muscae TaxID=34485 RepID=A0ACC2T462_9FUNG|nr:hypothetical protein DSO57_1020082 [Entomophthora muscae]